MLSDGIRLERTWNQTLMGLPNKPVKNGIILMMPTNLTNDEIALRAIDYVVMNGEGIFQCTDFVSYVLDLPEKFYTPSELFEYVSIQHREVLRAGIERSKRVTTPPNYSTVTKRLEN